MEQFGSLHITNLMYKFNDYFYRNLFFILNNNIFIGCTCTKGLCWSVYLCAHSQQTVWFVAYLHIIVCCLITFALLSSIHKNGSLIHK